MNMLITSDYVDLVHPQVFADGITEAIAAVDKVSSRTPTLHVSQVHLLKAEFGGWMFRVTAWRQEKLAGEWVVHEGRFVVIVPYGGKGEVQAEAWTEKRG